MAVTTEGCCVAKAMGAPVVVLSMQSHRQVDGALGRGITPWRGPVGGGGGF